MNIVILGAGALGSVLGTHLAKAGEDVTLIARGNRAAHLQEHGATITGLVDFTVPVTVVTDPHQVQKADILMVTVKTYDMEAALDSVKHIQVGGVLSIQNGVVKNEQLADVFGWEKVLGAMAAFSAEVLPIGTVRFTVNQGLYIGELPEGTSERVKTLANALERAGVVAKVTPSIQSLEWSKYIAFVCLMAPAVLTRLETYKVLQADATASIMASVVHEMARIAKAREIVLEDISLFPTKTLSQLSFEETVAELRRQGDQFASQAPAHKVSTLQDLEQGKRLEVEETLGYAVRQAAELGVPTPTMDTCYKLIAGINQYLQPKALFGEPSGWC
jgi:2-dehydropantoate 2-reductase